MGLERRIVMIYAKIKNKEEQERLKNALETSRDKN